VEPAAGLRAPPQWRAEIREKWGAVPPEIQAEIHKREREVLRLLNESTADRRFVDEFAKTVDPYKHYMQLEGGDPLRAFGDYLKTTAILRAGTPMEKANALAAAALQFGVDVRLLDQSLTAYLGGQPQAAAQQAYGPAQFQDPRVDQLLAGLQQRQEAQQRAISHSVAEEMETFASDNKHEFFDDVRRLMGDILEVSANQGVVRSLDEAYQIACSMSPEINKVLEQRKLAQQSRTVTGAARRAAASVSDREGAAASVGDGNLTMSDSIRDAISRLS
jgi:hypothetical protein